jgi:hypothetical protein
LVGPAENIPIHLLSAGYAIAMFGDHKVTGDCETGVHELQLWDDIILLEYGVNEVQGWQDIV